MTPDYIIKDIGRKLADDIFAATRRNFMLVDDPRAAFIVGTYGAASAIAAACAALAAWTDEPDPAKLADALWDTLRPMVISAAQSFKAEGPGSASANPGGRK